MGTDVTKYKTALDEIATAMDVGDEQKAASLLGKLHMALGEIEHELSKRIGDKRKLKNSPQP